MHLMESLRVLFVLVIICRDSLQLGGDGLVKVEENKGKTGCGLGFEPEKYSTLSNEGNITYRGEDFPWLTALYSLTQSTNKWELRCTGTLITRQFVLTAAHCVFQENHPITRDSLKVGFGKYYRDYYKNEDHSIIADVVDIKTQDHYDGAESWFTHDIALLKLAEKVRLTPYIMPVCIDWQHTPTIPVRNGDVGYVAGWGQSETSEPRKVAVITALKYMNSIDCKNSMKKAHKQSVTFDKFCAIPLIESPAPRIVESGGAITFVNGERHFMFGLTSTRIKEDKTYLLFTDINNAVHKVWIDNLVERD